MHVLATRFGSDEFGGFKTRRTGSLLARNRFEDKLRVPCEDTVPAEVAKGSVLLYVGSVYHGGGANRSAERRMGVNIGYTQDPIEALHGAGSAAHGFAVLDPVG